MRKSDKDNLVILAIIVGSLVFTAVCYFGTRYVPLRQIAIVSLLCEYFIATPRLNKLFGALDGYDAGFTRFVPVVNQYQMFTTPLQVVNYVTIVMAIVVAILSFAPLSVWEPIVVDTEVMNMPYRLLMGAVVLLVVNMLATGCGFTSLYLDVNYEYTRRFGHGSRIDFVTLIMLFMPVTRVCGILSLSSLIDGLLKAGDFEEDDYNLYEESNE